MKTLALSAKEAHELNAEGKAKLYKSQEEAIYDKYFSATECKNLGCQ